VKTRPTTTLPITIRQEKPECERSVPGSRPGAPRSRGGREGLSLPVPAGHGCPPCALSRI